LRLVARHADIWNNLGIYHAEVARKREVLAAHCRSIGRDPGEIAVAQQTLAAVALDRVEAARRTAKVLEELRFLEGSPELALTGTPDEIRARIERNRELGVTAFVMSFGRHTPPEDLRLFGREVIAAYR
jgi:alkanesulfonate monooxygenase SsuD/methylene tetrahydromethanopterin reductase-like flavin-dependent oxidoreductase (luciferase family)